MFVKPECILINIAYFVPQITRMKATFYSIFFLFLVIALNGQDIYMTRTAHVNVHSSNSIKDITADNYQVRSKIDTQTGAVEFTGLLKSFEFKLGALDRAFNSSKVNVSQFPKFTFDGRIIKHKNIDFSKPGVYDIEVRGKLYMWDEKRHTTAAGQVEVLEDGSIKAESAFVMTIEEKNVDKINMLMGQKLPDVIAVDMNTFGVSRDIEMKVSGIYKPISN